MIQWIRLNQVETTYFYAILFCDLVSALFIKQQFLYFMRSLLGKHPIIILLAMAINWSTFNIFQSILEAAQKTELWYGERTSKLYESFEHG